MSESAEPRKPVFLRFKQVSERVGLGRSAIYKMIREGNFPAPIKIGVQAVAWQESDIVEWCEQRIATSRSAFSNKQLAGTGCAPFGMSSL